MGLKKDKSLPCAFAIPLAMLLVLSDARAACLESRDSDIRALQRIVGRSPAEAEDKARMLLRAAPSNPARAAWIGSVIAESKGRRSLPDTAYTTAAAYLPLVEAGEAALRAELLWLMATNLPPQANVDTLETDIRGELERAAPASPIFACLLIARSELERRRGEHEKLIGDLVRAYTIGRKTPGSPHHIEAMRFGARMMASAGDVESALDMNARVIANERARGQDFMLGFAYGFRAIFLNMADRHREALVAASLAEGAARRAGDRVAPLYIAQQKCVSDIALGDLDRAEQQCLLPYRAADRLTLDGRARTARLLGQIALARGDARKALSYLDEALAILPPSPPSTEHIDTYRLRSEAYRQLGRDPEALTELDHYVKLRAASDARLSNRRLTLLRTRMSVDMELSRTEALTRTLEAERRLLKEQRSRWFLAAVAAVIAALLIARILFSERRHRRHLQILADTDNLTGALNRRGILDFTARALTRAREKREALSLAMIDIDHFKAINDGHGHGMGDRVLARLVAMTRTQLPHGSEIGRWGGEEFLLILPGLDAHAAAELVASLRSRASAAIPGIGFPILFSAGIASLHDEDDIETVILRADEALYDAKRKGRNQTSPSDAVRRGGRMVARVAQ